MVHVQINQDGGVVESFQHNGQSKYGRDWAGRMHWIAILGYRVESGEEQIFVADVGNGNTGWRPVDEFEPSGPGRLVNGKNMIVISEK